MLVPYVSHKLSVDTVFQLKRIIIGPTLHATLAQHSLEMLLDKYRVSFQEIVHSEIPYRDW